jgi:hypothetical protein
VRPLAGIPFESFVHLAITTDTVNPFDNPNCQTCWPELYHPAYPYENCWKQLRGQYIWTSWARVEGFFDSLEPSPGDGALFLPTVAKNRSNFKFGTGVPVPTGMSASIEESDEPPTEVALPAMALSDESAVAKSSSILRRPGRGATMIYAPTLNPNTYLHFSWLNENCAIRDYSMSSNAMPFEDRTKGTSGVRAAISHEVMIRNREPISNVTYWHRTTTELNEAGALGSSSRP